MKKLATLLCVTTGLLLNASPQINQKYSLKKTAVLIVTPKEYPVYSQAIEQSLTSNIERNNRFELFENAAEAIQIDWNVISVASLGSPGKITIPAILGDKLATLKVHGADSVVLAKLTKENDQYRVLLAWMTTDPPEVVVSAETIVDNRLTIDSFTIATENSWNKLVNSLPFEGMIISRDGFRVIIDRGAPEAWKKRLIPIYTLESVDGGLNLVETGLIEITDPQDNLSFGKILRENRPFQIEVGQKLKFVDPAKFDDYLVLMRPEISRNLASVSDNWFAPSRRLGYLDVDMGASILSFSQLTATGKGSTSDDVVYPNGHIRSELWVTRAVFFDASIQGAMASITPSASNRDLQTSQLQYQGQIGYKFRLQKTNDPSLFIKAGLYRNHLQVEASEPPIAFTSTTFTGLLTGAGARFPLRDDLGLFFEVCALLFPSFEEGPVSSGSEVVSTTLMNFAVGGTYRVNDVIDITGQLRFFSAGAELTGTGTRPTPIASIQQNSRSLTIGARYYF